jgi:hypothetical protein
MAALKPLLQIFFIASASQGVLDPWKPVDKTFLGIFFFVHSGLRLAHTTSSIMYNFRCTLFKKNHAQGTTFGGDKGIKLAVGLSN